MRRVPRFRFPPRIDRLVAFVALAILLAASFARAGDFDNSPVPTPKPLYSGTAPTISSGFGTTPSIVSSNGAATFRVNVGTGGTATSGVVGLPVAPTGWNCMVIDTTNNNVTRETASTTNTVTVTAAAAWAASDVLIFMCNAF